MLHDSSGAPQVVRNAICVHEEDDGVLWKHVDGQTGAQVRRRRRLVVSFHVTVANYEYLVYWRFFEDGGIECEVRATGIMVTTPFAGEPPPYGTVVDASTYAPIHQHFIVARLDMEVDGPDNTVVMVETAQPPIGPDNPHGLALTTRTVPLRTEAEGRQDVCWATQRTWKVTNPGRRNAVGAPVAYTLVPGGAIPPMLDPASPVFRRAQVLGHTLWVTPFDPDERWPCGEFVNQSGEDLGLPVWTAADRVDRGHRRRALVRLRHPPRAAGGGLAGDAGRHRVVPPQAVGLLRREPGARRGTVMARYGAQFGPDITFLGVERCDWADPATYAGRRRRHPRRAVRRRHVVPVGRAVRAAAHPPDLLPAARRLAARRSRCASTGCSDLRVLDAGDVEMFSGDAERVGARPAGRGVHGRRDRRDPAGARRRPHDRLAGRHGRGPARSARAGSR